MIVQHEDAQAFMARMTDVQLIWTDPPYGTNKKQSHLDTGRYYDDLSQPEAVSLVVATGMLGLQALTDDGVMALCLDRRAVHDVVSVLSKECHYLGDVIWHYESGGVSKRWWSQKHDTIALFANTGRPRFNLDAVPTVERKAPVTKGTTVYSGPKRISSVWNINMSTSDPQRVGYPSQKPMNLVRPFIEVHSDPGDLVVDPFCGSGTTLAVAIDAGRRALGCDLSPEAVWVSRNRLGTSRPI